MIVKLNGKRQVTFPARVLEVLGVEPGDQLELIENRDGFLLRSRKIVAERLAPLRPKLRRGQGSFDLDTFREQTRDPALRD